MDSKALFETVAPVIPVRDLATTLDRYRQLGFSVERADVDPSYGFANRGPVSLRLGEPQDTPYGLREFAYVDPEGTLHRIGSPLG
jgi:hypothetical protein